MILKFCKKMYAVIFNENELLMIVPTLKMAKKETTQRSNTNYYQVIGIEMRMKDLIVSCINGEHYKSILE